MSEQNDERPALVPRLRFPEFRRTGDWVEMPLGKVGEIVTGKTPSTSDGSLWNGDIQFVTPTDISEEKYQWSTQRSVADNTNTKVLPLHSTMFTCIASIGKMALSVKPCITNQQINTVIPNKDYANEFVYYSLLNIVPLIKGTQANSTLPIINKTEFSKFTLPVPRGHDEQQKIADCLSALDELITAETQKMDALKTHKKGLMQQLFPREGETVPRLRFPEFREAEEWEEKTLDQLGELVSGLTYSPDDVREDGLLVLRSSNVQNGMIALDDNVYVRPDISGANLSRPNDILICVRNGSKSLIGKNALIPEGMPPCTHGAFMTVFRSTSAKFIIQLFQTARYEQQVGADLGATINSINGNQLRKFTFLVPKSGEQKVIADFLASLDDLITTQSQKIETFKTHKRGLMQQLFPVLDEVLI